MSQIKTIEDVKVFFRRLRAENLNFHPDDAFADYVDLQTGATTYTATEAAEREETLAECFKVCESMPRDIYGICIKVFHRKEKTIDLIITELYPYNGAPMGRCNVGTKPTGQRIYDCAVPLSSDGAYDRGGAYWGLGRQLRVAYTKDLSYINFYRTA